MRVQARQASKLNLITGEFIKDKNENYIYVKCEDTGVKTLCVRKGMRILSENELLTNFIEKEKLMTCKDCKQKLGADSFTRYKNGTYAKSCKKCVVSKRRTKSKKTKAVKPTELIREKDVLVDTSYKDNVDRERVYDETVSKVSDGYVSQVEKLEQIYRTKNKDYGNSFDNSLDKFGPIAAIVRMSDKMSRIENIYTGASEVKEETISDTVDDLANYCIMFAVWLKSKG